jgi:hypothetical protein
MQFIFPVTVFHNGLKCYDIWGIFHFAKWDEVTKAYYTSVEGFGYVFVEVRGLKRPLTIPLYLENMDDFIKLIKEKDTNGILANQYR